jgi:hypothetical protein
MQHAGGVCSPELIRYIRVIRGNLSGRCLRVVTLVDKVATNV